MPDELPPTNPSPLPPERDERLATTRPTHSPTDPTFTAPPAPHYDVGEGVPGYVVLGELGRGGMGVVFKARQTKLNRTVALKMILGGSDAGRVARFLAEAEAVAASRHPNVVEVYECGEYAGRPFIALEYLAGGTLADRLRPGPLPPQLAAALVARIAAGVQAAHDQGIVHRDLKPSNILFANSDPLATDGLAPKVTDFGVARRGGSDVTVTGSLLGTPAYMAPEQARGDTRFVGPQADVWALGVILFECLTGKRPFEGDNVLSVLERIQKEPAPSPRALAPGVPRDLELICLKCLEKDPRDRYPAAAVLADDLERFLAGRSVSVRPAGPIERASKWTRRNPALAAALTAAVFALIVGSAVSLVFGLRSARDAADAQDARDAAERAERDATAARQRAEANLREAVITTASFITLVRDLEEEVGNNTAVLGRILRQTETNLERLGNAGDSPEVREQRATLHAFAAQVHLDLGRTDRALVSADAAVAGYEELLRTGRDTPDVRAGLSTAYGIRSRTYVMRGTTAPALADATRALELARALPSGEPRWDDLRATSMTQLADVYWKRGYFPEGDALHDEALVVRVRLAGTPAGDATGYRRRLARAQYNRALMLVRKKEPADAPVQAAYDLLKELAPRSPAAQFDLVDTCVQLADALWERSQKAALESGSVAVRHCARVYLQASAFEYLDTAARLCDGLRQADPENGERQRLNMYVRLVRSQYQVQQLPLGPAQGKLIREQIALADGQIPICRRYAKADPANARWRSRLSSVLKMRVLGLVYLGWLSESPPDARQEVARLIAEAWDEDRALAALDPDNYQSADEAHRTGVVVLLVRRNDPAGRPVQIVREATRPLVEFYARRVAREPDRADWRIGAAEALISAAKEYADAGHRVEAEAECAEVLKILEPAGEVPRATRLRKEAAVLFEKLRRTRPPG